MIQQKRKLCNNCNTEQFIWKNDKGSRYCKSCWYKAKQTTKPLARKRINPKSKKMQKPMCEAALPVCNGPSTDVHHKKGRGQYHLKVSTWLSVCRQCHNYIEEHPEEAIELGYSEKRI